MTALQELEAQQSTVAHPVGDLTSGLRPSQALPPLQAEGAKEAGGKCTDHTFLSPAQPHAPNQGVCGSGCDQNSAQFKKPTEAVN